MDFTSNTIHFSLAGGRKHVLNWQLPPAGLLKRSTLRPNDDTILFETDDDEISVLLSPPKVFQNPGIIYLDQNHWIDFAKWRKRPEMISNDRGIFYAQLAQSVDQGKVILPLSSAHFSETAKRGGQSRLHLAGTMLRYSRGWQMRSVLGLSRGELRQVFGGESISKYETVTLKPQALFDTPQNDYPKDPTESLITQLAWATTFLTTLLDDQPLTSGGQSIAENWAKSLADLNRELKFNSKARSRARDVTRIRFISELGDALAAIAKESGISPERFSTWIAHDSESEIGLLPGLSRFREILHLKIVNSDEKWEANDVNDLYHLSFAAGYFDLVIGEKKTINYLKRVDRIVPAGARLHRRPEDATDDFNQLIDPTI